MKWHTHTQRNDQWPIRIRMAMSYFRFGSSDCCMQSPTVQDQKQRDTCQAINLSEYVKTFTPRRSQPTTLGSHLRAPLSPNPPNPTMGAREDHPTSRSRAIMPLSAFFARLRRPRCTALRSICGNTAVPMTHGPFSASYANTKDDSQYAPLVDATPPTRALPRRPSRSLRALASSGGSADDGNDPLTPFDFEPLSSHSHSQSDRTLSPQPSARQPPSMPNTRAAQPRAANTQNSNVNISNAETDDAPITLSTLSTDVNTLRKQLLRLLSERAEAFHILDLSKSALKNVLCIEHQADRDDKSLPSILERILHLNAAERAAVERKLASSIADNQRLSCHISSMRRETRSSKPSAVQPGGTKSAPNFQDAQVLEDSTPQQEPHAQRNNNTKPGDGDTTIRSGQEDDQQQQVPTQEHEAGITAEKTISGDDDDGRNDLERLRKHVKILREEKVRISEELKSALTKQRTREGRTNTQLLPSETSSSSSYEERGEVMDRQLRHDFNALRISITSIRNERNRFEHERNTARELLSAALNDKKVLMDRVRLLMRALSQRANDAQKTERLLEEQHTLYEGSIRETRAEVSRLKISADELNNRVESWNRDGWKRDLAHRDMINSLRKTGDVLSKRISEFRFVDELVESGQTVQGEAADTGDVVQSDSDGDYGRGSTKDADVSKV